MSLPYHVTSDMVSQGLVDDFDKQRRGDTWFLGWKPSDSEQGRSFKVREGKTQEQTPIKACSPLQREA